MTPYQPLPYYSTPTQTPQFYLPPGYPYKPPEPLLFPHLAQSEPLETKLALDFGHKLFDGILPGTAIGGRQRKHFVWPSGVDIVTEDRVLVVLRAIKRTGFATLGAFLSALFGNEYNKHPTVYHTIAAFLQAKDKLSQNHPIAIIELIFGHRKSQEYTGGIPLEPNFDVPRYALPPSIRLTAIVPTNSANTTRNAMINWALQCMIGRFETETRQLLLPIHGFLRRPKDPDLMWDMLLLWNMVSSQETISLHAPAIFTLFTTIAVNRSARKKLDAAASPLVPPHPEEDVVPDETFPFGLQPNPAPWCLQAVTVFILALLAFRNRFAIFFPILIGVFLFTCNVHRDVIALLCRLGLSISYSMILAQLHVLGADSAAQLQFLGAFDPEIGPQFLLLFDNVNKMKRTWRATLGHKDEVKSGTAATAIKLVGVLPGAFLSEPLENAVREGKRRNLTFQQLYDDIDWPHIRGIGKGTILRIWLKHIPALAHHRPAVENLFSSTHRKHVLQLRKSEIHTARPTNIDESTTAGAASVLLNLILGQLRVIPSTLYRWMVMICGDQLSIDRVRKIKWYSRKAGDPFERFEWALPVLQLWHLKWNWQKCIFRLHWPRDHFGSGIFGLRHDCHLIDRGKFNPEKCDFYPAHHILEDRFDAVALDALRLLCEESTGIENGPEIKLLDALQSYFSPGGHLENSSFEDLEKMAVLVYTRYLSNGASEMARGQADRSTDVYGPGWKTDVDADSDAEGKGSMSLMNAALSLKRGVRVLITLCHFMRMTFWYLEMCAAVAEGDIGRVFEVIKLLRFSFWGAGSTNYGNELLELACNFLYEWSDELRITVLENYLVNPAGRIGHWLELDLLQEHYNFWIKALFNSKSHDFDSNHLSEGVGLNISGISSLRERFPGLFGLKKNGQKHRDIKAIDDINKLGAHFRAEHILVFESGRNQAYQVQNDFALGMSMLKGKTLKTFLERTLAGEKPLREEEVEVDVPPCPVRSFDGVTGIDTFITGLATE
ncbi:hypothetical protein DFH06DRAFT_997294 [Mycena polygramma]|nr:hypothetical protein DFH06DRAFT_997294 [Mycena polygramma]